MASKLKSWCLTVSFWIILASAALQDSVLHERGAFQSSSKDRFTRQRIEPNALLPIRIALKQSQNAVSQAESWLMDVSDPTSENYGRYWNQEEVTDAFRPNSKTIRAVTDWLHSHNIIDYTHSDNKQWLAFDVPAWKAEEMLGTEYFQDKAIDAKGEFLGVEASCDQYHLPSYLRDYIDFVKPGIQGMDITGRTSMIWEHLEQLTSRSLQERNFHCEPGGKLISNGKPVNVDGAGKPIPSNPTCVELVTPECIRALYHIPLASPASVISSNNALGLFAAAGDLYYQGSLDLYNERYTNIPAGYAPIFKPIDNPLQPPTQPFGKDWKYVGGEGDTDLEASMPIIYPQNATVFEIGGSHFFTRFLDAIDGSYCTPAQNFTHGMKPQCGIFKPTNVISMSFSFNEWSLSPLWQRRQCLEYLKLGLQGVSLFVSSGDSGVAAEGVNTLSGNDGCNAEVKKLRFGPGFPASCPWITAVGATQIQRNGTVHDPEGAAVVYSTSNGTPQLAFTSGGGFSNYFDRPKYQDIAVSHYFDRSRLSVGYNGYGLNISAKYNRHGRGYPDISANGKKYALCGWNLCQQLNCSHSAGTSISSPIVAAIFNRINEERIRGGKTPVGFVNPTLYTNPDAFNDIVKGGNGYCNEDDGFRAVPGWDPVTGMGTPRYPKLLDIFMKLP